MKTKHIVIGGLVLQLLLAVMVSSVFGQAKKPNMIVRKIKYVL